MIHRISSSLRTFKELSFRPGLNIVVAEKSDGATDRQTRNSSGKSSLIEIIHFLLGSNCDNESIFRRETLNEHNFSMSFDLGGFRITSMRSGENKSRVIVDGSNHNWPVQPKISRDGETSLSNDIEWRTILGTEMFGLPPDTETYGPTFRAMIAYFVRRESSGGFQDVEVQSRKQQGWDQQVNLSYLLGLDWSIAHAVQKVRLQEKALATLKREAKSGMLGSLVGKSGELRSRLTVAERAVKKLAKELSGFRVLPEYETLEKEASVVAIKISELSTENYLDQTRIESVRQQLTDEKTPSIPDLERMYAEVEVVFPSLVQKQLADVQRFHEAIVRNRKTHLQVEIDKASRRIEQRRASIDVNDVRRIEILETLSAHGALDQFNRLQSELSRQQAEVEELRKRLEMAKRVESKDTELKIERGQLKQRLSQDLDDRSEILNEAVLLFEEFSQEISDHEGTLSVESTENGPEFSISVEGKRSKGIRSMQIFAFDLMLVVLWTRNNSGPGFLIHDSHLFDGMDSRQVANAIELGARQSQATGFQYILTMNSNDLDSAEFSSEFDPSPFLNPVRLSDKHETGGLFGMRI